MKRSEMIVELEILLDPYMEGIEHDELTRRVNLVLTRLEQLGVQPPAIKEPCETFVLHNGQYIRTEDSFVFTHKWDDE